MFKFSTHIFKIRKLNIGLGYFLPQHLGILVFKRTLPVTQLLSETYQRPPVHRECVATLVDQLGRVLLRRAAYTVRGALVVHVELALAEVDQLDLPVRAHHHVLRLQVAVDDGVGVQLAECGRDLRGLEPHARLVQAALAVREHLAALAEVQHEAQPVAREEALVHADHEWVCHFGHHPAFVQGAHHLGLLRDAQQV